MCKIKINQKERALVNCKTGEILRPSCFDTLVLYHSYLVSTGEKEVAWTLLEQVFKGEKVISDMEEQAQKHHLINKPK